MSTELEHAAETAWALFARVPVPIFDAIAGRESLPAGLALDMVQEHTGGDRDDAVTALLHAAARWLRAKMPDTTVVGGHLGVAQVNDAAYACDEIPGESFGHAETWVDHVAWRARQVEESFAMKDELHHEGDVTFAEFRIAGQWRRWAQEAHRVIGLCRQVCEAAYPAEPTPVPDDLNGWQSSAE